MKLFRLVLIACMLAGIVCSCDEFKDSTDYDSVASEPDKDLSGSWYISSVTRNAEDITQMMDFSKFRLILKADQTYEIENYLPFLVRQNGAWKLDNEKYPSAITFTENGVEKATSFQYLIKGGQREIIMNISPGYPSNFYSYTLKKELN